MQVNMHEAKTNLSRLVEALESGQEQEVYIARNGRAVACLSSLRGSPVATRLGVARGRFVVPDTIDGANEDIAALFNGEG